MSVQTPRELLVFELSGFNFSVPLNAVEEVVPSNVITRIPASPPFLLGLSAVRGKVMGVIDAAKRYGIKQGVSEYFMVCHVRGNPTAITIDRPVVAGALYSRALSEAELETVRGLSRIDSKFIKGGFELLDLLNESGATLPTGIFCLEVDPDLFVSAEMASRVGEAV